MGKDLIISNLRRKRAYLAGEIEAGKRKLRRLKSEMYTFDRMLMLIDAGRAPSEIKGIQPHFRMPGFRQGEQTRLVLTVLGAADGPLLAREVIQAVADRKGITACPELAWRVRATLMRLTREGRIERVGKPRTLRWTLPR